MAGFVKLFQCILDSSIWDEPWEVKGVWLTMLAMTDPNGNVAASIPGLARRATVTVEQAERALEKLLAPDKYSKTTDNEGRRVEIIDGGWRILNYQKYRDMRDEGRRREQNREAQRKHRLSAKNADSQQRSASGSPGQPGSAQAEAEAEADKRSTPLPPQGGEQGEGCGMPKRKRRNRDQVMEPYPEEVRQVANAVMATGFWHRADPDGRPITQDPEKLCTNLDLIFRAHPNLTPEILIQAAANYLKKPRTRFSAPQWFYGAGSEADPAAWESETRMILHQESRKKDA